MSRLVLTEFGGEPRLEATGDLTPGAGEVLVAMEAAPINPADFLLAAGYYAVRPPLPAALGSEGVGRVVALGPGADPALEGRRVLVLPTYEQGTWADRVVVPARNTVVVGETADARQLAMLPINPATAHLLLQRYRDLRPGDWVGVTLGNSAVGQYVTTLARRRGIRVLAVVRRAAAAERIKALGADAVLVDDGQADVAAEAAAALGGARLRAVFDGLGGARAGLLVPELQDGGAVVSYSAITGEAPVLPLGDLVFRELSHHGLFVINWVRTAPREEIERTYGELAALVEDGTLAAEVEATYALADHAAAFAHARRGERGGKVLFTF
ncbi:MAG TPA: zinc-dependent alcohol dehydrogenase family protein [Dactylosporangium sp.]|jgi:NADPH:quinone reductase-like Zn-dependent oxidoreductase|nr:zinc-dependent alcohol dehydrogenase family protein [Dactylosporangium sp.]